MWWWKYVKISQFSLRFGHFCFQLARWASRNTQLNKLPTLKASCELEVCAMGTWGLNHWGCWHLHVKPGGASDPATRRGKQAPRPGRWQGMVTTLWSTGGHKDWLKMIYWLISPQKWGGWMLETIDILWYFVCLFCFPTDSHHVWAKTTWTPMESLVVDQIHLGFPRWNWQRQGSEVPVFEVGAEVWMDGWWPCFDWCFNTRAPQNLVVYTFSQFP